MVKEEILRKISISVNAGVPLKKAMLSLYNAGYPKEEIEKAAREFQVKNMVSKQNQNNNQKTLQKRPDNNQKQENKPEKKNTKKEEKDESEKEKQKEDIIGGLELAVSKGVSLKKAMISFYKAGYPKETIVEAAKEYQKKGKPSYQIKGGIQNTQNSKQPPAGNFQEKINTSENSNNMELSQNNKKSSENNSGENGLSKKNPTENSKENSINQTSKKNSNTSPIQGNVHQNTQQNQQAPVPKRKPGVSDYDEEKPDLRKYLIILYIFISVLFFIGALTGLFIFKEEILEFFKNILSNI